MKTIIFALAAILKVVLSTGLSALRLYEDGHHTLNTFYGINSTIYIIVLTAFATIDLLKKHKKIEFENVRVEAMYKKLERFFLPMLNTVIILFDCFVRDHSFQDQSSCLQAFNTCIIILFAFGLNYVIDIVVSIKIKDE